MDWFDETAELFGIKAPNGYSAQDVNEAKTAVGGMPALLEEFYLKYGASAELHGLQDELILPNQYKRLLLPDYIVFFNENQGCCQAAIRKSDIDLSDPPVFIGVDNDGWEWRKSSDRLSDFLTAMFGYQASLCLPYAPEEFYWITEDEKRQIESLFAEKGSFDNWIGRNITVYGDCILSRISLMNMGDGFVQLSYAASDENEFERLKLLLKDIGEAV